MSLDNEPMKVSVALRIAKQYYPQDKLEHASLHMYQKIPLFHMI